MDNPKISIVVPVYNKEAYLAETLDGLLEQSLKEIEIIVVDDCSTDSIDFLKNHYTAKDERIKWHTLDKNMGRSYARNIGINLASAPIIAVNDADDISFSDRMQTIAEYFDANPDISVAYSNFIIADVLGNRIEHRKSEPFDIERIKKEYLAYICHSTMAYRTEAVRGVMYDIGEYSKLGIDDWKLQMDLYKAGHKFGNIDKFLVKYRLMDGNTEATRDNERVMALKKEYLEKL